METEYRRDLQHSYLVIHAQETEEQDYTVRMIVENRIEGLLALSVRRIDRQILFYYDITSKISVAEYCQFRKITGSQVRQLLWQLVRILASMEEYLLSGEFLCLQADYIYADAEFTNIEFCFIPGQKSNLAAQFQALMEYFLPVLNHEKKDEMLVVYQIYGYAVQEQFSLDSLRKILQAGEEKENKREERDKTKKEALEIQIREEAAGYDLGEDQDEEYVTEQQRMKKEEHERALEAFFEDEQEERRAFSPWITAGAVLVVCCLLIAWYIWRNWPQYRWGWIGFSVCIISVYAVLSNRRLREDSRAGKNGQEETRDHSLSGVRKFSRECGLFGDGKFSGASKLSGESDLPGERFAAWHSPEEWNNVEAEKEEYTRVLQPGKWKDMAAFKAVFPATGHMLPVTEKRIQLIGHQEGKVDLLLESDMVSRIHAKLRREEGHFYLSDLNSRNGTWVNGEALEGRAEIELYAGDEVKFADQIYNFICGN